MIDGYLFCVFFSILDHSGEQKREKQGGRFDEHRSHFLDERSRRRGGIGDHIKILPMQWLWGFLSQVSELGFRVKFMNRVSESSFRVEFQSRVSESGSESFF